MTKQILSAAFIFLSLLYTRSSSAQTVETGHEAVRGQFNFMALADSYAAHPPTLVPKEIENDEDQPHLIRPAITDLSLIHGWSPVFTPGPAAFSPAPTDTFESTLDNGTGIPPDTHGAVDSNYCMTTINTDVRIQTRTGAIISTVSLDAFFSSVLPGGGTFDPRCHYDINSHRWIVVADGGAQSSSSCLLIAVSKTSNPTGGWWTYKVFTYPAGTDWLDYPDVGFNNKWIAISGNLFPNSGSGYDGCKMFVFNKANLLSGAGAPFTAFTQATSSCICPAITYDAAQTSLFCLESWNGAAGSGGQLRLWKITGAVGSEAMTSVGFPASSGFRWQSQAFDVSGTGGADFAPQVGTANKLQTNDDRIFQVCYMNGKLWTAHNVFLPYSTTVNATRCSAQWWQVDTLANPIQIGVVDDISNTNFYTFPSIVPNAQDDALIGFSTMSAAIHPSAAYAVHFNTDAAGSMQSVNIFRNGTNTYYKTFGGSRDRWGDYSAAVLDPLNQLDFWTIQEASASPANTWDTWWAYVKPCNPPGATITASGPTNICAGSTVNLNANTGTGLSYQWRNGGTPIAGATNATYTASTAGTYDVIVTFVTCTSTSAVTTVAVNAAPPATITPVGSTTLCSGGSVTLDANTGVGLTYQWQLAGSPIPAATGAVYTATVGGNYTVVVTNSSGCSATSAITAIIIGISPPATITPVGSTTFCSGSNVLLNANTGAGLTYQWRLAGSPIVGATNDNFTATTGGNYSVTVTNLSGCSTTSGTTTVVVNPAPAAITGATFIVCAGSTITLSDATPGGSWSSSNPAVATVTGSGVVSGLGSGGVVTISYTASGCPALATVTVNSVSVAAISGASAVCVGQSIPLTDATPGGSWSSSAPGIASVGTSGSVTGMAPGSATISYNVSTSCGTSSVTHAVTVSTPTAVAAITGTTSICSGLTSLLSDATPSGVWSSSNTAAATITGTGLVTGVAPGTSTISYSVTNTFGCTSMATVNFTVSSSVAATVTASGPTTFCTGANVTLTSSAGISYQWIKNGINIAGATAISYTATTTGNYAVAVTITGGCNGTSPIIAVSVNPLPVTPPSVDISATAGPVFCLATSPATFTAIPTNGGTAPTYQWFVNGAGVSSSSSFSYSPAVGDIIKVTMTSNAPCAFPLTASKSDTVSISTMQTPSVTVTAAPTPICAGLPVTFTAHPLFGGTAPLYRWTKNGINVATGPEYIYSSAEGDAIIVTLFSNYACLSVDTAVSPVYTVHTLPDIPNVVNITVTQAGIVAGSSDTFMAIAPGGGTFPIYQWLLNGVPIPGATNAEYITSTLTSGQVISCRETSSEPCAVPPTATSGGITVKIIPVGVHQMSAGGSNFTLIPNPNNGEFTINGDLKNAPDGRAEITVTDLLGQVIYHSAAEVQNGVMNEHIALAPSVANGNYIVTITSGTDQVVYHMVVTK